MTSLHDVRASLVELSRRHSRVPHEVEDLAHDIVLSALRRGIALDGETFLRSARGAARRHGAFLVTPTATQVSFDVTTDVAAVLAEAKPAPVTPAAAKPAAVKPCRPRAPVPPIGDRSCKRSSLPAGPSQASGRC